MKLPNNYNKFYTPEEEQEIMRLYHNGMGPSRIAKKLGRTPASISCRIGSIKRRGDMDHSVNTVNVNDLQEDVNDLQELMELVSQVFNRLSALVESKKYSINAVKQEMN
jgi:IS30 family transposase